MWDINCFDKKEWTNLQAQNWLLQGCHVLVILIIIARVPASLENLSSVVSFHCVTYIINTIYYETLTLMIYIQNLIS